MKKKYFLRKAFGFFSLLIAIIITGNTMAFASCTAVFTSTQTANNEISFVNSSLGTGFLTSYSWDFGDGYYSSTISPVHIYNVPGTYTACLSIFDSTSFCSDSACFTFNVTGSIICALSTQIHQDTYCSCGTCADGSASVYVSGGAPPYTYNWNTLPSQTTSQANGLLPGVYTVCITDVNGCSACDSIMIDTLSCYANFNWIQSSSNIINFTSTSISGLITNYQWDFGDSTFDFVDNPIHHYNVPGTYSVCLSINDSIYGCADSFCDSVVVTGTACNIVLSPSSTDASCPTCQDGSASVNISGGTGPYSYLWSNGATISALTGLSPGQYGVCVTDVNNCTQCTNNIVIGPTSNPCSASFMLYPDSTLQHVYFGINLSTATAPATYVWSWGDGSSDTAAYPTHTYASAGTYTICLSLTDSTGCTSTFCDSMYLMKLANAMISVTILPQSPTGIIEKGNSNTLSIFPNPAKDYAVIRTNSPEEKLLSATIINSLGNIVAIEKLQNNAFDISKISQGVYFVKFQHQNGRISSTRLVIVR
jgi:PKD repeat protein